MSPAESSDLFGHGHGNGFFAASGMNALDYATIIVYLAAILGLGFWLGRRIRSGKDFFLGGRSLPWWAIGMSLVVSDIGAKDIVGLAQDAYKHGWVMANWDWIGCIPAMLLAGLVFVPYFWAGGFYTVPEYFGRRYNEAVQVIATLVWGLFIGGNIAVIFSASNEVIVTMLGLDDYRVAVLIASAAFVGLYTYFGGLAAVVYTDVIQCVLMIAGMATVLWLAWQHPSVGGWEGLEASVSATHPDHFRLFHPPENPSSFTMFSIVFGLGVVLGPAYWIGNQVIVQRVLGARSLRDARNGVFFGALIKTVFPVLLVLPGILAIAIIPETLTTDEETKQVFPRLVRDLLPGGFRGVVFAAMVAGMMGNLDSYLNSASTLWTKDIIRRYFLRDPATRDPGDVEPAVPPGATDDDDAGRLDLRVGRVLTVLFLITGVSLAPFIENIFKTMQWMLSMFQGPALALLLFGLFWRRATPAGGLAGMVVGLASSIALDAYAEAIFGWKEPFLHVAWWSFVASCVAVVAVSLMTRPHPEERLRGLVFGTKPGSNRDEGR